MLNCSCSVTVILALKRIDAGILRDVVLIVIGGQPPEDQRHCDHVLQTVIAIGRVIERAGLVDDPHTSFLRLDDDLVDIVEAACNVRMQRHCRFDGGLRMKLGRKRQLEQDIFHDVGTERALELDRCAAEQHVLEPPGLRGYNADG